MRRSKLTESQIVEIVKTVEGGLHVAEVIRKHPISWAANAAASGQSPWSHLEQTVAKRWYSRMLKRSLLPDVFAGAYDELQP